jgi:adenylate cyclase
MRKARSNASKRCAALPDPKIAEHRARLVKTTGDGLLVEFSNVTGPLRCAD